MTQQTIDHPSFELFGGYHRHLGRLRASGCNIVSHLNRINASDSIGRANSNPIKYVPAGTGSTYQGPGDQITFLITGAETGGAFFVAEVAVVPGGGPSPHVHSREAESFYLQQGTLAVQVGDQALNVSAGDFVHMPRGVVHSFKNVGKETAKLLVVVMPAGLKSASRCNIISHLNRINASESIGRANSNPIKYVPAGTGPTYQGPGDQIRFLIAGEETGGAFFMAEVSVPPGGGTRPHVHHREEESFHILEGTLRVHVGGNTVNASPGDFVHLPRGIVHSFQNTGRMDAKFLLVVTPAGLEKFFEEAFYPAADRSMARPLVTEAWLARVLAAAPSHGLELAPPA